MFALSNNCYIWELDIDMIEETKWNVIVELGSEDNGSVYGCI